MQIKAAAAAHLSLPAMLMKPAGMEGLMVLHSRPGLRPSSFVVSTLTEPWHRMKMNSCREARRGEGCVH